MEDIDAKRISEYPKRPLEDIEQSKNCTDRPNCINCPWVAECYREDYDFEDNSDLIYGYDYDDDLYYDEDYYGGFDD